MAEDTNEFFEEQLSNQRKSREVAQDVGSELSSGIKKIVGQLKDNDKEGDRRHFLDRTIQGKTLLANSQRNKLLEDIEADADRREEKRAAAQRAIIERGVINDELIQPRLLLAAAETTNALNNLLNASVSADLINREDFATQEEYGKAMANAMKENGFTLANILDDANAAAKNLLKEIRTGEENRIEELKRQGKEQKSREKTNILLTEQLKVLKENKPEGGIGFIAKILGIPIAAAGLVVGFLEGFFGFFIDLGKALKGGELVKKAKDAIKPITNFFKFIGSFTKAAVLARFTQAFATIKRISEPFISFFRNLKAGGLLIIEDVVKRYNSFIKSAKSLYVALLMNIELLKQSKFVQSIKTGFQAFKSFFTGIFTFFGDQFKKIKAPFEGLFGKKGSGKATFLQKFVDFFKGIGKQIEAIFPYLKRVFGIFRTVGGALGRLTLVGTILFAIFDGVMGLVKKFQDGFKTETLIGKIFEGLFATINGVITGFVGALLNLVGLVVGLIFKLFGLDELGDKIMSFNFIDILYNAIQPLLDFVAQIIDALALVPAALFAAGKALAPGGKKPDEEFMRVMGKAFQGRFAGAPSPDPSLQNTQSEADVIAAAKETAATLYQQSVQSSTTNNTSTSYTDASGAPDRATEIFAPYQGVAYQ